MKYRKQNNLFQFGEDLFSENAERICKVYHEVLIFKKILQTKPQVKNIYIKFYDLYYNAIKNRDDNEIKNDEHEKEKNDYIVLDKFITPNHDVERKNIIEILT